MKTGKFILMSDSFEFILNVVENFEDNLFSKSLIASNIVVIYIEKIRLTFLEFYCIFFHNHPFKFKKIA